MQAIKNDGTAWPALRHDSGRVQPPVTDKYLADRRFALCERVIEIAGAFFSVSSKDLRDNTRGTTEVARVRQIAMYVCHVGLGISMTEIGRGFGRNRATVMHACHMIEDMRDDIEFDRIIHRFEAIVRLAFRELAA